MKHLKSFVFLLLFFTQNMLIAQRHMDSLLIIANNVSVNEHYGLFNDSIKELDSAEAIATCQKLKAQDNYRLLSFFAANYIALKFAKSDQRKEEAVNEIIEAINKVDDSYTIFERGEINYHAFRFYNNIGAKMAAIEHLYKSIGLFEQIDQYDRLAKCWNGNAQLMYDIGYFQNSIVDFKLAIDYYWKAEDTERQRINVVSWYNDMALCFRNLESLDSAVHYFNIALGLAEKNDQRFWSALINGNISLIFMDQGRYAEAKDLLIKDIRTSIEFEHYNSAINAQIAMADLFLRLGEADSAKSFLDAAILSSKLYKRVLPTKFFLISSDYYRALLDFENSLEQLSTYVSKKESEESSMKQASDVINTRFDYNLDIVKMKLEESQRNQKTQEKEIIKQRLLTLLFGVFLLFSIILVLAYIRKNKIATEALLTVEKLNKRISGSNLHFKQSNEDLKAEKQKLNEALKRLETAQAQILRNDRMTSLGILTRGISHEINNPLNLISLGLDVMKSTDTTLDSKEKAQLLDGMSEAVLRASQMVRNLGEFSKDSSKQERIEMQELIENSLGVLSHDISQMGLTILKEYHPEPLFIYGYSGELHQVVLHLLSKCMQSMENSPKIIRISTFIEENCAIVFIQDNGKGLNREEISHIFDPFHMMDEREPGLYLTYRYVENNSGQISCSSKESEGTAFNLSFPLNYQANS